MPVRSDAIGWSSRGAVRLLDQTLLPGAVRYVEVATIDAMVEAIAALRVRGAPLIGVAAAMGLAAAVRTQVENGTWTTMQRDGKAPLLWLEDAVSRLGRARPTAVNLRWALERMHRVAVAACQSGGDGSAIAALLHEEAGQIWDEDAAMCEAMGREGLSLVPEGATVLTICNTGMLATGGIGSAFGVIRTAHEAGRGIDVIACETRPLGQGARLTAWELARLGIPGRLIVDGAAAAVMASGEVDLVLVGADRIAANGDAANKVGTYALAVLARAHDIAFYVVAPSSTLDLALASGDQIPIEQRASDEVAPGAPVPVFNPAFDVTPAELITAIVTDRGVRTPPYPDALAGLESRA